MRATHASLLLGLGSTAYAQLAKNCPGSGICYQLNIPSKTASQGKGDIFFQISAPTSFSWVAMGQGDEMSGAQIFVLYTDPTGNNVTLSPRLGTGHVPPQYNPQAEVTLLEGTGIVGNTMVANVKCSSCSSWNSGSMDFSSSSASFIYAALQGDPMNADIRAQLDIHQVHDDLDLNFAQAKGGSSLNPFLSGGGSSGGGSTSCRPRPASATASKSGGASTSGSPLESGPWSRPTSQPTQWPNHPSSKPPGNNQRSVPTAAAIVERANDNNLPFCDEIPDVPSGSSDGDSIFASQSAFFKDPDTFLKAHGILACMAFVILFPFGAIMVRLLSFPGLAWLHAAFQIFAYCVYIAAFGIGVYIRNNVELDGQYHPIIGIVVLALVFFQPILGFVHHLQFKKTGVRSAWSYVHLWVGRVCITLGIINGGLGLMLADNSQNGKIAYGVVAGVIWLVYVVSIVIGEKRRASRAPSTSAQEQKRSPDSPRS